MTSTTTSAPVRVQGDYVVAATDDITVDVTGFGYAFVLDTGGAPPTLTVLGTVHVDFADPVFDGACVVQQLTSDPAAFVRIGAGGSLIIDAVQTTSVRWSIDGGGPTVPFENDGLFSLAGGGSATGWTAYPGVGGSFVNTGTFSVSSNGQSTGVYGLDMASWTNSGMLVVSGAFASGVELVHLGGDLAGSTIDNSGTLRVTGGLDSAAIDIFSTTPFAVTISNSGTISGPYAIRANSTVALDLTNTKTIDGTIYLHQISGGGTDTAEQASHIHNSGVIHGDIYFAGGDGWLYDGRGGTLTGALHLGLGSATVLLGDEGETVYGLQTFAGGQVEGLATITGGAGDDTYVVSSGDSWFDGGGGVNTSSYVQTYSGVTVDLGLQGVAQNTGGGGIETLSHIQNLIGSYGSDTLTGNALDNVIDGGPSVYHDVLDGAPGGEDTVSFASSTSGVTISLSQQGGWQRYGGNADAQIMISNFRDVIGSARDDTISGDGGDNVLDGGGGVNTVSYANAAGVTVSLALQGAYQVTGGAGADLLRHFQNLTGSAFSDHLTGDAADNVIDGGGGGTDVLDGGGGTDTLSFASAKAGVTFSLALQGQAQNTGGAGVGTAFDFQNLIGSAYDDHLTGDDGNNLIDASGGGVGSLRFGGGHDVLDGGAGINTLSYATASMPVTVSLALQGQAQTVNTLTVDTLSNFQNLSGSINVGDVLEGDSGDNVLDGGSPNPPVNGQDTVSYAHAAAGVTVSLALQGQAQDTIGAGTDTLLDFQALTGSAFDDALEGGGAAATILTGGLGADTFAYHPGDGVVTITDFAGAQGDVIDLSHLVGFNAFTRVLAASSQDGADTVIATDGGALRLQNLSVARLTASNFVLGPGPTAGPDIGGAPTTGSGTLSGSSGDDWLQGGGGNDALHGGAGSDYLEGGAGLDTAIYDGVYRQYALSSDRETVTGGPEGGSDILADIQRIQFVDGYLATSPTDAAGQVYRIYKATLGRAPDAEGLADWVHALAAGTSLQTVADGFVSSREFQLHHGALDNANFVSLLYYTVLQRTPDTDGLNNWVNALSSGQQTRAQVVLGFSESREFIADQSAPVQHGLWIQDAAAAEAARLYDTVFGRLPDVQGLANWTRSLESGMTLQTAAAGFVASPEFQTTYGALDDAAFLTLLYRNVLHRAPDTEGLDNWMAALNFGHARAEVVMDFSESQEHVADTAAHIDEGIWIAG